MKNKIQKSVFVISLVVLSIVGTVGSMYAQVTQLQEDKDDQVGDGRCVNGCVANGDGCDCYGHYFALAEAKW